MMLQYYDSCTCNKLKMMLTYLFFKIVQYANSTHDVTDAIMLTVKVGTILSYLVFIFDLSKLSF